jgi:hypothetical protein
MNDPWPRKADAELQRKLDGIAVVVRNELAAAGLPVVAPGLLHDLSAGAEVTVEPFEGGGVFIEWHTSPRLSRLAMDAMRHKRTNEYSFRRNAVVTRVMNDAIISILASGGFTVKEPEDEYRPLQLQVMAVPGQGTELAWEIRDDELTFPGWEQSANEGPPD